MNLKSEEIFRTWKYVDVLSFSRLLFGTLSPVVLVIIIIASLIPLISSIKLWWNLNSLNKSCQELLLASAITLTIIINLHFAIYDTVILVLSILLSINVLYRNSKNQDSTELSPGFKALLVAIYILPWISQHIARITGLQLFTLAVAILGSYQIALARSYFKQIRTPDKPV